MSPYLGHVGIHVRWAKERHQRDFAHGDAAAGGQLLLASQGYGDAQFLMMNISR